MDFKKFGQDQLDLIPYQSLPIEILRADGTCPVTLFSSGITTMVNAFVQHENSINPSNHLTEEEWLERFTKFVCSFNKKL